MAVWILLYVAVCVSTIILAKILGGGGGGGGAPAPPAPPSYTPVYPRTEAPSPGKIV